MRFTFARVVLILLMAIPFFSRATLEASATDTSRGDDPMIAECKDERGRMFLLRATATPDDNRETTARSTRAAHLYVDELPPGGVQPIRRWACTVRTAAPFNQFAASCAIAASDDKICIVVASLTVSVFLADRSTSIDLDKASKARLTTQQVTGPPEFNDAADMALRRRLHAAHIPWKLLGGPTGKEVLNAGSEGRFRPTKVECVGDSWRIDYKIAEKHFSAVYKEEPSGAVEWKLQPVK